MGKPKIVLGLDCGSSSVAIVALDDSKKILARAYAIHCGCPKETTARLLQEIGYDKVSGIACTSSVPLQIEGERIDSRVAVIECVQTLYPGVRTLFSIGAERFLRVNFGPNGEYTGMKGNSACAAGTGSFLDQQARRLGLSDSAQLSELAMKNPGERPSIASRCSVFAKTDLTHAQAEGWSKEEICDGLCLGLARNIEDTLFAGAPPVAPIVASGGVALNRAVIKHLRQLCGNDIIVDEDAPYYGAIGAALKILNGKDNGSESIEVRTIVRLEQSALSYSNAELPSQPAGFPDFGSKKRFLFTATRTLANNPVEVDVYESLSEFANNGKIECWFGLDIGSTSTKAAFVTDEGRVLCGLYTRTGGMPLEAMQSLCEAAQKAASDEGVSFVVKGCSTTGSGRKLVGTALGADVILDEITAHARAAVEIDPEVDTVIEIGGQDSKFTTIRNGTVTFSQMNTVCAAGTGSFLEEQAQRLGVSLDAFGKNASGARSPLTSDRCTVFMERDLNHFQAEGYSTSELLAASLFSVCDNYLSKVAQIGSIGNHIQFQGATAKNGTLVAAFERRLQKKIGVSKFCHLTGAIGGALQIRDEADENTGASFVGLDVWQNPIASRSEVCTLCHNRCRLRIVKVEDEEIAYGFLCGRDYGTVKYVAKQRSTFDVVRERKAAYAEAIESAFSALLPVTDREKRKSFTIGITRALTLANEAERWKAFFEYLGFTVKLAEPGTGNLLAGKRLSGAEYCAPVAAYYGEVKALYDTCDAVFMPIDMEETPHDDDGTRMFCNYTQWAPVTAALAVGQDNLKILSPMIRKAKGEDKDAPEEIAAALGKILPAKKIMTPDLESVRIAYQAWKKSGALIRSKLLGVFHKNAMGQDVSIVLIGRPYVTMSPALDKGVPQMIESLGVPLFFHDMVPGHTESVCAAPFHWSYPKEILSAAEFCTEANRFYPVLMTSFKCSPDSFVIDRFKETMEKAGKPYLILQVDEHDSGVGYETRIEAGIRAFRNHYRGCLSEPAVANVFADPEPLTEPKPESTASHILKTRTILMPNWDPVVSQFCVANMQANGIDARIIEEDETMIRSAMTVNTGQCIPVSVIAWEAMAYVEKYSLDPSKTAVWIPECFWPCAIAMYPSHIKELFARHGQEMGEMEIYAGNLTFTDVSWKAMLGAYFAYLSGGILSRLAQKTRPYESVTGTTDQAFEYSFSEIYSALSDGKNPEEALKKTYEAFRGIAVTKEKKKKAAIFGDFYARDNAVFNQNLVRDIEKAGGEAVTASYLDYIRATADAYFEKMRLGGDFVNWLGLKAAVTAVDVIEKYFFVRNSTLGQAPGFRNQGWRERIGKFGIRPELDGECFDNLLKIFRMVNEEPDISLLIQTNPAFCCPSVITESMSSVIEKVLGIPIVSITYDGTGARKNDVIYPYLNL